MKRFLLILFTVVLAGCGDDKDEKMHCEVDLESDQMVLYDDGVYRKSDIEVCTNAKGRRCVYARWVNDHNIVTVNCTGGAS